MLNEIAQDAILFFLLFIHGMFQDKTLSNSNPWYDTYPHTVSAFLTVHMTQDKLSYFTLQINYNCDVPNNQIEE